MCWTPTVLDHFYFLVALSLPFGYKDWRTLLWWVTLFTIGHTISLLVAYKQWVSVSGAWVEFLIPVTIALTAAPILVKNSSNRLLTKNTQYAAWIPLIFGLIHGLGFGRYFSQVVLDEEAYASLIQFALGVEAAQLIIVGVVVVLIYVAVTLLKTPKKWWEISISLFILFQALLMAYRNFPPLKLKMTDSKKQHSYDKAYLEMATVWGQLS